MSMKRLHLAGARMGLDHESIRAIARAVYGIDSLTQLADRQIRELTENFEFGRVQPAHMHLAAYGPPAVQALEPARKVAAVNTPVAGVQWRWDRVVDGIWHQGDVLFNTVDDAYGAVTAQGPGLVLTVVVERPADAPKNQAVGRPQKRTRCAG